MVLTLIWVYSYSIDIGGNRTTNRLVVISQPVDGGNLFTSRLVVSCLLIDRWSFAF